MAPPAGRLQGKQCRGLWGWRRRGMQNSSNRFRLADGGGGGARTFCGGGRLRSPEQEQWLHRAWTRDATPAAGAGEVRTLQNLRARGPYHPPAPAGAGAHPRLAPAPTCDRSQHQRLGRLRGQRGRRAGGLPSGLQDELRGTTHVAGVLEQLGGAAARNAARYVASPAAARHGAAARSWTEVRGLACRCAVSQVGFLTNMTPNLLFCSCCLSADLAEGMRGSGARNCRATTCRARHTLHAHTPPTVLKKTVV